MPKRTLYCSTWEKEFHWIAPVSQKPTFAFCKPCRKEISLSNKGKGALNSHRSGEKHRLAVASTSNTKQLCFDTDYKEAPSSSCFQVEQDLSSESAVAYSSPCSNSQSSYETTQLTLSSIAETSEATTKAEIIWLLKVVHSHFSFRSVTDVGKLFSAMFPDSAIAKNFSLGYDKASYNICFGLAPYFEKCLLSKLHDRFFAISFDESLNEHVQKNQLDIHVRFWDERSQQVVTQYFTSEFLGYSKAIDLKDKLLLALRNFSLPKIIQFAMDGPSVNWKMYNLLSAELFDETDKTQLLCIGSCGLHIVHNAFKQAFTCANWQLAEVFRAAYKLFKDAPARRSDFITTTSSQLFPLKFCGHRWLENLPVAERLISILDDLKKYVDRAGTDKAMRPRVKGNWNYDLLVKTLAKKDLLKARLEFFVAISRPLSRFLTIFQSEKPLLPFLSGELDILLRGILQRIIQPPSIPAERSLISDIEITDDILLSHREINVGIGAKATLCSPDVSKSELLQFSTDAIATLKCLYKKLALKSPLRYLVVRAAQCFDPAFIHQDSAAAKMQFRTLATHLYEKRRLTSQEADDACDSYSAFTADTVPANLSSFIDFSKENDRLDDFYFHLCSSDIEPKFHLVLKFTLVLFHGNASVERGFKINKDTACPNMQERTLKALRLTYDGLQMAIRNDPEGDIYKVPITNEMLSFVRSSRQRYRIHLQEQQHQKNVSDYVLSRKRKNEEIIELQRKRQKLDSEINLLTNDADELAAQAEAQSNMNLLTKSNALRKAATEKKDMRLSLLQQIKKLKEQL